MNDMEKSMVSESEDFAAMLEETMTKVRSGQVVKGVVAHVSDDGVASNSKHRSQENGTSEKEGEDKNQFLFNLA